MLFGCWRNVYFCPGLKVNRTLWVISQAVISWMPLVQRGEKLTAYIEGTLKSHLQTDFPRKTGYEKHLIAVKIVWLLAAMCNTSFLPGVWHQIFSMLSVPRALVNFMAPAPSSLLPPRPLLPPPELINYIKSQQSNKRPCTIFQYNVNMNCNSMWLRGWWVRPISILDGLADGLASGKCLTLKNFDQIKLI